MYSLNMPVSRIRTKVRQEFERHRYVSQLPTVDVLLFQSHSEYQVSATIILNTTLRIRLGTRRWGHHRFANDAYLIDLGLSRAQETLNYWKQLNHVLKYFREDENPTAKLPQGFMQSFLEVSREDFMDEVGNADDPVGEELRMIDLLAFSASMISKSCDITSITCEDVIMSSGRLLLHEIVPGYRELVHNNVTQIHQVIQSLLQYVVGTDSICKRHQQRHEAEVASVGTHHMSVSLSSS